MLSLFFSAIRAAKALPLGSGLRVPSDPSIALPPALACASSTRVRPLGARFAGPPLFAFAILFLTAILLKSSPPEFPFFPLVKLGLRVGDVGVFSYPGRFVELGILESRRFGDVLRSLRAVLLACGRRSGALDNVGREGAVTALPAAKMFPCKLFFGIGAVLCESKGGLPVAGLKGFGRFRSCR